jgi:hypothetical protein
VVSKRRLDDRDIRRRGSTRPPKRRILIVCEGRETEPGYFRALRQELRNPRVEIQIETKGASVGAVRKAIRMKETAEADATRQRDENLRWDQVWNVFDVDEHPRIDEARKLAEAHGIALAISNPCFELWLLLHFQDQRSHIERHRAYAALRAHLSGYEKSFNPSNFLKVHDKYQDALKRARELDREAKRHGAPGRNPTTGVYRLTESIRSEGSP